MSTPRRRLLAQVLLGVGLLAAACYLMLPEGLVGSVGFLVVAAVGVVMSVLGACLMHGARRRVWVIVAVGQVLYFVGDVLWFVYESVLHIAPYPSIADAAYLVRYPLVAVGLMWLIRGRRQGRDRAAFLDAAIISTGFAVVGSVFVVAPAAVGGGETLLSQVVAGAYPVADLLLLAFLIRLFTSGAARSLSFWSLASGLGIMLVVDIWYTFSIVSGAGYPVWLNTGYILGYLLIGFSALHPSVDHLSEPTPSRPERMTVVRLTALGLALALAPLTELVATLTGFTTNTVIVVSGALVGTTLVLTRMEGLLRSMQAQAVQLSALARNDGLTGVANRRTWDHELSRACAKARENDWPLAVALMDLDHFKVYNDLHGHQAGDRLLKAAAAAWQERLGSRGFLARYGGEEFTVLLPDTTPDAAHVMFESLRALTPGGQTCSIGAAVWDGLEEPAHVLARADAAVYLAKQSGRNRLCMADVGQTMTSNRSPRPQIALQPIVALETLTVLGHEALSRFDGQDPSAVFAHAATIGAGPALEAEAIRRALDDWRRGTMLCVNVSLSALPDPQVQQALPADLTGLVLEISEKDAGDYTPALLGLLSDLRGRGARIAIDDWGRGFSNAYRLLRLEPDIIKIDIFIVQHLDEPAHRSLIRAIVLWAGEVGVELWAEGVETEAQRQALLALGVATGQGFLLGRPTIPDATRDVAPAPAAHV
ncbi:MAG: EAL domain-containing protein [Actinomycetes bacterium]